MTRARLQSPKRPRRRGRSTTAAEAVRVIAADRTKAHRERDASICEKQLPKRFAFLFPGYRLADIRLPEQDDLVMLHILSAGGSQHRAWLRVATAPPLSAAGSFACAAGA